MSSLSLLGGVLILTSSVYAQTWCGKVYMQNESVVPPGGSFPIPATSSTPLLALRCNPALHPYLPEDARSSSSNGTILVDALVRHTKIAGAVPISLPSNASDMKLSVTATIEGNNNVTFSHAEVPLNGTTELAFDLSALTPQMEPFTVTCTATDADTNTTFTSTTQLSFLPEPPSDIGSVTKMDLRTGGLLAKPLKGGEAVYEAVLPVGFYSSFDGYLDANKSVLETLKAQGFNVLHPVPSFDNTTALNQMLDWMEELGQYLIYDLRGSYLNSTSTAEQVNSIKSRSNLLLYYTADEPDGPPDPTNGTGLAKSLITSLDPYHPTSLVLNCFDYFFEDYASGGDIVLQDVYEIGNNVTFSSQWGTPCTDVQGDCGCDDCMGEFEDIRVRVETFKERFEVLGWERNKSVWTVPQGFGNETYWTRYPTGAEWLIEAIVGINAGALGATSWIDPTTADIKAAASLLAQAVPSLTPFMLPIFPLTSTFKHVVTDDRIDVGIWTSDQSKRSLVLAANLNYFNASIGLEAVLGSVSVKDLKAETVLVGGALLDTKAGMISFGSVQSGAWIVG